MAKLLLFLFPAILGLVIPRSAEALGANYLLSGETLPTNGRLRNGDFDLVMQEDCNAVLFNTNWQSLTANRGRDCELTLTNRGEIQIRNGEGILIFSSRTQPVRGNYTLLVHPQGRLVVYGPSVFTIIPRAPSLNSLRHQSTIPFTNNMLFSGQVLYGGGMLGVRNHRFVMQGDCNLVLSAGSLGWQTNTNGNGEHCFLRLNHKGELIVMDDDFRTIWSSRSNTGRLGDYVFILQDNGFGVIYGPSTWSSRPRRSIAAEEMTIGMVTEKV